MCSETTGHKVHFSEAIATSTVNGEWVTTSVFLTYLKLWSSHCRTSSYGPATVGPAPMVQWTSSYGSVDRLLWSSGPAPMVQWTCSYGPVDLPLWSSGPAPMVQWTSSYCPVDQLLLSSGPAPMVQWTSFYGPVDQLLRSSGPAPMVQLQLDLLLWCSYGPVDRLLWSSGPAPLVQWTCSYCLVDQLLWSSGPAPMVQWTSSYGPVDQLLWSSGARILWKPSWMWGKESEWLDWFDFIIKTRHNTKCLFLLSLPTEWRQKLPVQQGGVTLIE